MTEDTPQAVLDFWFGSGPDVIAAVRTHSELWWSGSLVVDDHVRQRFGRLHSEVVAGLHEDWLATSAGRLALVIVLDQFSRHLYRGSAVAFACDLEARRHCREGIAQGADRELPHLQRVFFWLPLQHSEFLSDQDHSVALNEQLVEDVPAEQQKIFRNYLKYARDHQDVIRRYGRFPTRNAVLGRASRAEEELFLAKQ